MSKKLNDTYTVESVTSGHPDKVCDQISDSILDACLAQDPKSRVGVETFGSHGHLIIGGEVTTKAKVDYKKIAARVYREIGYTKKLDIHEYLVAQSPDIAQGVDTGGAGDQGIMYGFATDETPEAQRELLDKAQRWIKANVPTVLFDKTLKTKTERYQAVAGAKLALLAHLEQEGIGKDRRKKALPLIDQFIEQTVTKAILDSDKRVDGRKLTDIYPRSFHYYQSQPRQ